MSAKKRGIRYAGLDALLATSPVKPQQNEVLRQLTKPGANCRNCPIELLYNLANINREKTCPLKHLKNSHHRFATQGVIQPIVVRQIAEQKYEIIAGERRWRAAQIAQLRRRSLFG